MFSFVCGSNVMLITADLRMKLYKYKDLSFLFV